MSEQQHKDEQMLDNIRATLDRDSEQLDADTKRALQQARHQALAQLDKPRWIWQPIAGVAVAASVTMLVVGLVTVQTDNGTIMHQHEDLSLLSSGDDLELYENLEFYQWLAFEERSS